MPSLPSKIFRRRKRLIKDGTQDGKTFRLYRAACLLLATRDYEQIPVSHFAQQADMSVGAVYERFTNKDTFLSSVVAIRFSDIRRRMTDRLDVGRWQHQSAATVTWAIVDEMMRNLHGYGAGVVRAALKRGHGDRAMLEPLQHYRSALADQAVALLADRVDVKRPEQAVRAAVQMAEATALDALLHDKGPLRLGSRQMAATLSAMMLSVLALTNEPATNTQDDDDKSDLADDDDSDGMLDMPIEEVVAIPVSEPPPARRSVRRKQTEPVARVPTVRPVSAQQPPADEKIEPLPRKRRYRPVF